MRRVATRIATAAAAALYVACSPGVASANTLNVAGGYIESGWVSYANPEPIVGLCSSFNTFWLDAPANGAFLSLGGAEFNGDYEIKATGTTECLSIGNEEGLVTSASVTSTSSTTNSTLSCSPLNGDYVRSPTSLTLTLSGPCAVDGATVVGATTFHMSSAWQLQPNVNVNNPVGVIGFYFLNFQGAVEVTPDTSVGLGVGPPVITSINPTTGPTTGGAQVQIQGVGFSGGGGSRVRSVTFGNTAATAYTVVNDNLIVATTPAEPVGSVLVQVTTDGGPSAAPGTYNYEPPSVVSSVSPNAGGDASAMTIFGSGFFGGQGSDHVQQVTLRCAACGGASISPSCKTTVSDTEIDIPAACAVTPGAYGFKTKTIFDVVVTTDVSASVVNTGDRWTYIKQLAAAPVAMSILSS